MDEIIEDDQNLHIGIKKPFQPKFIKELNIMQNEKLKKSKRKHKEQQQFSAHIREKLQKIGLKTNYRSLKKLPETTRNGVKVYGQWKNNQINGEAQVQYSNGVIFRGFYHNGIKIKGHFTFLHGYQYIGHCLGNKFNGQGSLFFPSGKVISGEWKDYNIVEKGKIEYPNGQVYYGEIDNLKKHGQGHLFFKDGSKYVGEFAEGQICGYGTYFIDDQAASKGRWKDGELIDEVELDQPYQKQFKSISHFKPGARRRSSDYKGNHRRNSSSENRGHIRKNSHSRDKSPIAKKLRFAEQISQQDDFEIFHKEEKKHNL